MNKLFDCRVLLTADTKASPDIPVSGLKKDDRLSLAPKAGADGEEHLLA